MYKVRLGAGTGKSEVFGRSTKNSQFLGKQPALTLIPWRNV